MLELILSRKRLGVLTGFLTRHRRLAKHMAKIGLKQNSDYNCCGTEDETLERNHGNSCQPSRQKCNSNVKPSQFIKALKLDGKI